MNKNPKGITLIALVITIIILLILAGVTISAVVKRNGVLSNATKSAVDTATANAKEEIERVVNSATTDCLADNNGNNLAEYIDQALDALAHNGSDYSGITYAYEIVYETAAITKTYMSSTKLAMEYRDPPTGELKEPQIEYHILLVYYNRELILTGRLNMNTGDFNLVNSNGEAVKAEKIVEKKKVIEVNAKK